MKNAMIFLVIADIIAAIAIIKEKDEIMEIRRQQILSESRLRRYIDKEIKEKSMNYTIEINKSNEGTPVLTITKESIFGFRHSSSIVKAITGERAVDLWKELTGQKFTIEDE